MRPAAARRPGEREDAGLKTKKKSLITKIVILALLIYTATSLLGLQGQIQSAQQELNTLKTQVAEQNQRNAELSDAVEHSDDPDVIESVARSKGYVAPGEKIFVDVAE